MTKCYDMYIYDHVNISITKIQRRDKQNINITRIIVIFINNSLKMK